MAKAAKPRMITDNASFKKFVLKQSYSIPYEQSNQ